MLKIGSGGTIDTMAASRFVFTARTVYFFRIRDRTGPEDIVELFLSAIEKLRRPAVLYTWEILHHRYGLLPAPVDEIRTGCIADDIIIPAGSPDHVESTIGSKTNARVTHKPVFSHCRREHRLVVIQRGPMVAVIAVGQTQPGLFVDGIEI